MLTRSKQQGLDFNFRTQLARIQHGDFFKQTNGIKGSFSHKESAKNALSAHKPVVDNDVKEQGCVLNWNQGASAKETRSIQTVSNAPFHPYHPWQQQEYEYFNGRGAVRFLMMAVVTYHR